MRENIDFDASVEDGQIRLTPEQSARLKKVQQVHISAANEPPRGRYPESLQKHLDNPVYIPDFQMPSRDEMHER